MATKPIVQTMKNSPEAIAKILNTIRDNGTADYQSYVPKADPEAADSVRAIGSVLMDYVALRNEFVSALMNRIGLVLITSKAYQNPLAVFKKGFLDYGETIEEVFVSLAQPYEYDPSMTTEVFKKYESDIRSAFHHINYKKFYPVTINDRMLRQAFLSWAGVADLIDRIVESMYSGMNYDEWLVTKFLLARLLIDGRIKAVTVADVNSDPTKAVTDIKAESNALRFMNSGHNMAGVRNYTDYTDQYIITTSRADAVIDVNVLASAFNMDKAEFMGHRLMVDSFDNLDTERLDILMKNQPGYTTPSAVDLALLKNVVAVIVDRDFFVIVDNLLQMEEQKNAGTMSWNYFLHTWKVISASPFAQAVAFTTDTPSVTGVTVSPKAASGNKGNVIQFTAAVDTNGLASKAVKWSCTDGGQIDIYGNLTILESASTTITVTATSVADPDKSDNASVSVSE